MLYGYLYATTTVGNGGTQMRTAVSMSAVTEDECGWIRYGFTKYIEGKYWKWKCAVWLFICHSFGRIRWNANAEGVINVGNGNSGRMQLDLRLDSIQIYQIY